MKHWYEDGKQLKAERKRLGLTQAKLAELAGVSQSLITAVEREIEDKGTDVTRRRIANVLVVMRADRIKEMSATPKEKMQMLKMERDNWKRKAQFFGELADEKQKTIDLLKEILNLKTASAITDTEAQEKIAALGLEERSQAENEARQELEAFQGTRRTVAKK
jgi:transcriptional regulator with XRE-family HTH domain